MTCAACGKGELSPPYPYTTFEDHFRVRNADRGLLGGTKDLLGKPESARVCLGCGHVMTFVGDGLLAKLRAVSK
jgi:hypothetical protein